MQLGMQQKIAPQEAIKENITKLDSMFGNVERTLLDGAGELVQNSSK